MMLASLPREVERIARYADAPYPGARVESHDAERFRLRRFEQIPDVDAHAIAHDRHLVDEGDVDRPERIFEYLRQLGNARIGDRDHRLDRLTVELGSHLETRRS